MDVRFSEGVLYLTHEKVPVVFSSYIMIDGYEIDFPGEYEKSGVIAEVRQFADDLSLTRLTVGDHTVLHVPENIEEFTADMTSFAGNVDVLIVPGKKELQKTIEKIDARVVIPYGSSKSALF